MTDPTTDAALAAAFLEGQPGSRDALLARWLPEVLQWCARLGGPRVDPEDAAQDVLVVVIRRVEALDAPENFGPWLFGITRNVLRQHRRRAWVRRWIPGASTEQPSAWPGPERTTLRMETGRQVLEILERVPAAQREVLVLCDLEERTAGEVARLLGVPEGTVRSRLRLGRARFRKLAERRDLTPLRPCEEGS
ncbi:MAG: sigma-70 family RNA polymerase sigma factor [Alphaproteobacteria bacterium]|nr:sigma-70 family RNA polymerase sigma factor [Alphaproteobacteria bacterium]